MPIYALALARKDGRTGPDLVEAKEGCEQPDPARLQAARQPGAPPPRFCGQAMMGVNQISAIGLPTSSLTPLLSRLFGRTVVDQTGLKGNLAIIPFSLIPPHQSKSSSLTRPRNLRKTDDHRRSHS